MQNPTNQADPDHAAPNRAVADTDHRAASDADGNSMSQSAQAPAEADEPSANDDNRVRYESAVCELCGRPPTEHLLTTRDYGWRKPGEFSLVRCTHCNLIITTPRPVPECMPVYYEDWYNHKTLEEVREEHESSLFNRFVMWMRLKILEKTGPLRKDDHVLDVGAGFGAQLQYYIRRRGIRATALDFDPTVTDHSLVADVAEVRTGDLLNNEFADNTFDVVTLYETLEHVYQPKATLEEAMRILKPGGRLVVEVPDYDSPWRKLFKEHWFATMVPSHLHHFTRDSLGRVVRAAGFEPIRHVAVYVPFESSNSIAVARAARRRQTVNQAMKSAPFFIALLLWTIVFDLPLQFWLWLFGRTGVQALIARKPGARGAQRAQSS